MLHRPGLLSIHDGGMAIQGGFRHPVSTGTDIEAERFEGRAEHVASFKATRFHSLDELLDFIVSVLTEIRSSEQP